MLLSELLGNRTIPLHLVHAEHSAGHKSFKLNGSPELPSSPRKLPVAAQAQLAAAKQD